MTEQDTLFGDEQLPGVGIIPDGHMVRSVRDSVTAINEQTAIPGHRRVYVQVAIELARNIEAGNRKGRAIANEAMQLAAIMQLIEGDHAEDGGDGPVLPEDVREFMAAIGQIPTVPPAP